MVKVINEEVAVNNINISEFLKVNANALISFEKNEAIVPERIVMGFPPIGSTFFKPAAFGDSVGIKIVSVRDSNPTRGLPAVPASIVMIDKDTGIVTSILEGDAITAARTAAGVITIANKIVVKEKNITCTVFGTGPQAYYHILCILNSASGLDVSDIAIVYRTRANAEKFMHHLLQNRDTHKNMYGNPIKYTLICGKSDDLSETVSINGVSVLWTSASSLSQCLSRSRLVCLTTSSKVPVLDGSLLSPNTVVTAVGTYLPDARESDDATLRRSFVILDSHHADPVGDIAIARANDISVTPEYLGSVLQFLLDCQSTDRHSLLNQGLDTVKAFLDNKEQYPCLSKTLTTEFSSTDSFVSPAHDCVFIKSVGLGVQDVASAEAVFSELSSQQTSQ